MSIFLLPSGEIDPAAHNQLDQRGFPPSLPPALCRLRPNRSIPSRAYPSLADWLALAVPAPHEQLTNEYSEN